MQGVRETAEYLRPAAVAGAHSFYVYAINENRDEHSHVYFRFFNEVPVLFLFGIVLLVVLKPS